MLKPLEEKYRVIVPAMDGMYDNSPDFTNFPDQARQMEDFINENYGGKLRGVYGISQGVAVLSELLARNNVQIDIAVFDGGYVAEAQYPKILHPVAAFITAKMFGSLIKNGGKSPKIMDFLFFKLAGMDKEKDMKMFECLYKGVSQESVESNIYENYTYRANPDLKNTDTMVYLWCGSKEPYVIKSYNIFKKYLKNYKEEIFADLGHGYLLFYHTDEFCKKISAVF